MPDIRPVTITMLGYTGSGKTTYMLGMYSVLSSGFAGYFTYAADSDDDLRLTDDWEQICEFGKLPEPTTQEQSKTYSFVFKRGLEQLLVIDWMDYRGGAMATREASPNSEGARQLGARLRESDSIYLTLDGRHVGEWLQDPTSSAATERARRRMLVGRMTRFVHKAVEARRDRGLPPPSLAVLITKSDVISQITGRPRSETLPLVRDHLAELVPIAHDPDLVTLICPVQVGYFGLEEHATVEPGSDNPVWLHKPLVFSLMHYLTEGQGARQSELEGHMQQRGAASAEVDRLRAGFFSRLRGSRIRTLETDIRRYEVTEQEAREQQAKISRQIEQLLEELRNVPVVRYGEPQWEAAQEVRT